jgi:ElaB/YqjD/DUF883 family membrane-anchored ribosome-binding protein
MPSIGSTTNPDKNGKRGPDTDFGDVGAQIDRLRKDITELTKTIADLGASKTSEVEHGLVQASREAMQIAKHEVSSMDADLKARIRDNPVQSIGIAAGIGFLVAMLARR